MFSSLLTNAVRSTSLIYTQITIHCGRDAHNVLSDGLFIGTIPIKEVYKLTPYSDKFNNEHKQIIELVKKSNPNRLLKLVVSVVQKNEFKGEGFASVKSMVTAENWKAEGVDHHLLEMEDFTANVSNKEAIAAVLKMRKCIEEGGAVYVHCKAGRSRSIMMCAIYLAIYGTDPIKPKAMLLSDVILLLQEKRKQMAFDLPKIKKAEEIIKEIQSQSLPQTTIRLFDATLEIITEYLVDEKNNPSIKAPMPAVALLKP